MLLSFTHDHGFLQTYLSSPKTSQIYLLATYALQIFYFQYTLKMIISTWLEGRGGRQPLAQSENGHLKTRQTPSILHDNVNHTTSKC